MSVEFLIHTLFAGSAAVGFGVLFKVPKRYIVVVFLVGALGFAVRGLMGMAGYTEELSTLAGAFGIGILGWLFAKTTKEPAQIVTIASAIPLVPGSLAFKTLLLLLSFITKTPADPTLAANVLLFGFKTSFVLAALALGITAPSLLYQKKIFKKQ